MSFSNPSEDLVLPHPCTLWIEYKAKKKAFEMYNKEAIADDGSKGVKVDIGSNPMFIFLDSTFTVSGYSERLNTTLYSNEMKIAKTKEAWMSSVFHVKTGNKSWDISGNWKEIKDLVDAKGGKLTINAYVGIKVDGQLRLACMQFNGASYSPWKDFQDKHAGTAIHSKVIKVVGHEYAKTGSNEYNTPVFDFLKSPLTPETIESCTAMDLQLQEYFKNKLEAAKSESYTDTNENRPVQIQEEPRTSITRQPKEEQPSDEEIFGEKPPVEELKHSGVDLDEPYDDDLPF